MRLIIYTFLLFNFYLKLVGQITPINTGTNTRLSELSVISNSLFINGNYNYLAKSNDACNTLTPLAVNEPFGYSSSLNRLDSNIAFILFELPGAANRIYRTLDGGLSWSLTLDTSFIFIKYLHFFDTLEGVAICDYSKLLRTMNGGKTWTTETHPVQFVIYADGNRDSTLCITSLGGASVSKDRGRNWIYGSAGGGIKDIHFFEHDTLFTIASSNNGSFFSKTFNNGLTWNHFSFIQSGSYKINGFADPYTLYCKNINELYIAGLDTTYKISILKTTDLGNTWSIYNTSIKAFNIWDFKFLNDSIAFLCGDSGKLFKWNLSQTVFVSLDKISPLAFNASLLPNPAEHQQRLSLNTKIIAPLQIYLSDITGVRLKQMYNGVTESGTNTIHLNIAQIPSGIYFYEVKLGESIERIRFVKQ
jgi:photosystem II stability/assembly factor-like uncharacterized protein